ncbi:hypothetical protein RJ639_024769 [Escallonia herrerae]|uniref:Mei2-like C-terminal RNA recognition motif domain-containing protein n=1 Tax=Escallonia herrerae TaxID=1293975 RepID=A0AA88UX43_9ASTE|nr:hypothetical protein RJ639_024769 [Escallonia herrerae]
MNSHSRKSLMKLLDKHCSLENERAKQLRDEQRQHSVSAFDFVYLPMDFRTGYNRGYAFVNFTNPRAVWKFYEAFNNRAWYSLDVESPKTIHIVSAKIQGKEALVSHFDKSVFFCKSDEFLPVCFSPPRDGASNEDQAVTITTIGKRITTITPCTNRGVSLSPDASKTAQES